MSRHKMSLIANTPIPSWCGWNDFALIGLGVQLGVIILQNEQYALKLRRVCGDNFLQDNQERILENELYVTNYCHWIIKRKIFQYGDDNCEKFAMFSSMTMRETNHDCMQRLNDWCVTIYYQFIVKNIVVLLQMECQ